MSQPSRLVLNGYYRRPTDTANNFTVTLPTQITNPKVMSINSANIPFLCYNFGESESRFYFQTGASTNVNVVTLNTQKVYVGVSDFVTDFQTLLRTVDANLTVTVGADGRMSIASTTKINVIGIENREYNWNATYYNNCALRLGFYNASPVPMTTVPVNTLVTGTGSLTLVRTTCFYVCIDAIAGDSFTSNSPEQCVSTILFQMPVTNATFGALNAYYSQEYLLFQAKDLPYSIYNVNVRILDDNFDDLDLLPSAKVLVELSFKYDDRVAP